MRIKLVDSCRGSCITSGQDSNIHRTQTCFTDIRQKVPTSEISIIYCNTMFCGVTVNCAVQKRQKRMRKASVPGTVGSGLKAGGQALAVVHAYRIDFAYQ